MILCEYDEPFVLFCPACNREYEIDPDDDLCYADDVRDESTTPCPGCGVALKVIARMEVWFSSAVAEEVSG